MNEAAKNRTALWEVSERANKVLPRDAIETIVQGIVDHAYRDNLDLSNGNVFIKRAIIPTINGKVVKKADILQAMALQTLCPQAIEGKQIIEDLLVIAMLTEDKGEDLVSIALQFEIEEKINEGMDVGDEMRKFVSTPPREVPWRKNNVNP